MLKITHGLFNSPSPVQLVQNNVVSPLRITSTILYPLLATHIQTTLDYCPFGKAPPLLKVSHDGMSCEITKLMQIPMNTLCYLIKLMPLFPSCVIYSPFVALSIFAALSNFCRIIKLLPSWGFKLFSSGSKLVWWFHKTSHCVKLSAGSWCKLTFSVSIRSSKTHHLPQCTPPTHLTPVRQSYPQNILHSTHHLFGQISSNWQIKLIWFDLISNAF